MKKLISLGALLAAGALSACGGATDEPSPPLPSATECAAGKGVVLILAPPEDEYSGCLEVPNTHADPRDTERRGWCCWQGTAPW